MNITKIDYKTSLAYYKTFLMPIITFCFVVIFFIITYVFEIKHNSLLNTIFKGLTSFCFFINSCFWFFKIRQKKKLKNYLFLFFVLICFISDIAININFISGMCLFFIAHLLYLSSCYFIKKVDYKKIIWFIPIYISVLLIINLLFGLNVFQKNITLWVLTNFYGLILSSVLIYTFLIYLENKCIHTLTQLIAMTLFASSDILLMFNSFLNESYLNKTIEANLEFFVLILYYSSMNISSFNIKNI